MSDTSNDEVIKDILKKIERERNIAQGASNIRKKTNNAEIIQNCNTSIREAQQNIEYLEQTLSKLQLEQHNRAARGSNQGELTQQKVLKTSPPTFTFLDLLKYDCPSLGHRIHYMLQLLEFKLQVEKQYREANEKISRLYQVDGDRRSIAAAEGGKVESDMKIHLMKMALKNYHDVHVNIDEVARDTEVMNTFRKKPLSGTLSITINSIRDILHVSSIFSKKLETLVSIRIDDVEKARTKPTKNQRVNDSFQIHVEKGNELSLIVYDKVGDTLTPVAMIWFLLSDIVEEIRKKKVDRELNATGWMSASNLAGRPEQQQPQQLGSHPFDNQQGNLQSLQTHTSHSNGDTDPAQLSASAWFVLAPAGQILLTMGFNKTNDAGQKKEFMGGLGRHGAIRQRKEEVLEQHGHKFVPRQFYNIMMCAMCGDFLPYSGYQCEDCRFLCHKKCYQKVITKCISKSSIDVDPEETKLNHRIPHKFEPFSNHGTKWCCHCGYILPWSRKNVYKCSECGVVCHAQCTHLVPDFCGMSMEMASKILSTIKETTATRQQRQAMSMSSKSSGKSDTHISQKQLPPVPSAAQRLSQSDEAPKTKPIRRPPPPPPPVSNEQRVLPQREEPQVEPERTPNQAIAEAGYALEKQISSTSSSKETDHHHQHHHYHPQQQPQQQVKTVKTAVASDVSPTKVAVKKQEAARRSSERHHGRHRQKYGLDDFRFIAVLGKGNFGKVMLAESIHTGQLCAIKVLKKDFIIKNDEVASTKSEKRVFIIANRGKHPFLLNLHQCFQTENRIYFVMEYVSGGDLMWHAQQRTFSPSRAKFYAAEVLLALQYFHENGVVYRDLKLDNILLTADGHIKLADYGLCKEEMWYGSTTATFCGTPEFMAPEILKEQKYDKAVDWWAFGVLLYQMMLGKSPFKGEDEDEVFNSILTDEPRYPIQMDRESVDILQQLLTKDPYKRLGASEEDAEEIKRHPYFHGINWDDIMQCKVPPPLIPTIKDRHDVSNFDVEFTTEAPKLTPVNSVLSLSMQEQFRGFTYVNDDHT
ncbi:Serine/threonine kinase [Komagataella phaffii CBS 7435]|uniref:Protein kinase C-like 1 n=2 Tax=Komagataella phaffii TaxID=460519 RepID=C4QZQ6_KOMPG|nr:Elongation factor 2 (EF-2), also encoded by EFT1 [Komagataella phaffii GS115]AOA62299.1 GQ67_00154T0 [Komagataella phaffii]CAH2448772.1 Serine/threonine kinase [Komagataella phaffii CBS 7435]AOA68143.1 GQ68_01234T0 [Komagataella phaffii GS115]CAY68730.1 Elongation factor 2 (EF-2), also encoded by EFT1 [Komagataella phaffii GS115]SCV12115.1 Serine/threonine kinase [Komagataella phaffii CBS 7435]